MGSPISAYRSESRRASASRRLLRLVHLLVLCAGTALVTHGVLAWRLDDFRVVELDPGDPAFRSVLLLAVGVVLVPLSLLELFHLDARAAPGASSGAEPSGPTGTDAPLRGGDRDRAP